MREALSGAPALAWFCLDAPAYVISYASSGGLGAIPLQDQGTRERKPIAYTSQLLTLTERRYIALTQQIRCGVCCPSKIIFPVLVSFVETTYYLFSHQICQTFRLSPSLTCDQKPAKTSRCPNYLFKFKAENGR